jgi:hypothetical protein
MANYDNSRQRAMPYFGGNPTIRQSDKRENGMAAAQEPDDLVPSDIRTEIPHPARVCDFWLGGKDNFAADRAVAEQVLAVMPEILDTVRGNRRFLARAVAFLRESGIRQFLDLGSGLPSSPSLDVSRV